MPKVTHIGDGILFESDPVKEICFGVYECNRCGVSYTVNRPDTWNPCTPELCHDCVAYIKTTTYMETNDPELRH